MANDTEKLTQELTKNYSKVQKRELDYVDYKASAQKTFTTNTKSLTNKLNKTLQNIASEDKEVIKNFKTQLKVISEENKNFQTELKAKRKHETEKNDKALEALDEKFKIEDSKVDESLTKINKQYAEQLTKYEKEYTTKLDRSNKDKDEVVKKTDKEIENLDSKYEKEQIKTNEKIISLNSKKDEKIQKTKESKEAKAEKIKTQLATELEKTNNWKSERHPVYLQGLEKIDKEIQKESSIYEEKYSAIKSTMESRVARREKFVNRAQSEGDSKAVKAQNKEIKKIKMDAEKELKILQKNHFEDSRDLSNKRRDYMKSYMNEIAEFDKKFVDYKENRNNQLALLEIELYKDIAEIDIDFRNKINAETKKLNEFYEEIETKKANLLDEKERSLLNADNEIELLSIKNIEQKEFAATENEKQIALHTKEHEILKVNLEKDKELEKIELEKILAKFDFDEKVKMERFETDQKVLVEEEAIEHHQKEFERQTSVADEFKEYQDEFSLLYRSRAKDMSEYEELEATNRYSLKIKFLEKQLELVQKDADKALSKVNQRFDEEIQKYNILIEAGSSGELEELVAYESKKKEEIQKDVDKRNTLDPKAYKKQIKDLDHKIDQMRKQLSQEVDERKHELESKIQIFKDEIANAEARRDTAISEIEGFLDGEVSRLNKAVELLNLQLDAELLDISKRKDETTDKSKLFDNQSKIRREKSHQDNENYMTFRTKEQRDNIHTLEYQFEGKRNEYDNEYQESLGLLKNNHEFKVSEANEKLAKINTEIQEIEALATKKNEETTTARKAKEQTLQENLLKNSGRLDVKDRNHRTSITNVMYEKNTAYEQSNTKVNEDVESSKRKYDLDMKQQAKNYSQALAKELEVVELRLKQELQTVL